MNTTHYISRDWLKWQ